ncbi:MAG: MerR family transcriptional regulator [Rickettsiales bacterium]
MDFLPKDEDDLLTGIPAKTTPSTSEKDGAVSDDGKAPNAFKTISEVATFLNVPQHVLRFWESKFSQIKPLKLRGGRRYYRPEDIETLSTIKTLLYKQGYTIKGAKKAFSKDLKAKASAEKTAKAKPAAINDKQRNQLTVIRHELVALQDTLKPFVF